MEPTQSFCLCGFFLILYTKPNILFNLVGTWPEYLKGLYKLCIWGIILCAIIFLETLWYGYIFEQKEVPYRWVWLHGFWWEICQHSKRDHGEKTRCSITVVFNIYHFVKKILKGFWKFIIIKKENRNLPPQPPFKMFSESGKPTQVT